MTRAQRHLRQIERIAAVFDQHHSGVSKPMLVHEAAIPDTAVSARIAYMRGHATEIRQMFGLAFGDGVNGRVAKSIKIGGQWIYGWAVNLYEHISEQYKRRLLEKRSLLISVEMLEQSIVEHPDDLNLRRQLGHARARLELVEIDIADLVSVLPELRKDLQGREA